MIDSKTRSMKHILILFYKQLDCVGLHWMRAPHVERRSEIDIRGDVTLASHVLWLRVD